MPYPDGQYLASDVYELEGKEFEAAYTAIRDERRLAKLRLLTFLELPQDDNVGYADYYIKAKGLVQTYRKWVLRDHKWSREWLRRHPRGKLL